jgi:hypothetical protein
LQPHGIGDYLLIACRRLEGGETLMSEASYSNVALVYIISGELTMLQVDTSLYYLSICLLVHFAQNNAIVLFFLWFPNMVLKYVHW